MQDETDRNESRPTAPTRISRGFQAAFEVCLLLGIVVGIELLGGDSSPGAYGLHPHPYWLVVLPMAAGRGLFAGLLAATLTSAIYVFGARETLGIVDLHRLMSFEVMREPILFYAVSFVVGELHDVVIERMRALRTDLEDRAEEVVRLSGQRDVLREANRTLERRFVDQHGNFGTLLDIASRTEDATREEIFEVALELVEEQCGASASVFIPHVDGQLVPFGHRGWSAAEASARVEQSRESESLRRALLEGREVNAYSIDEDPPDSGPLVVSPLYGASGVIEALLCLEDVPTSILNNQTIRSFQSIGRWASAILSRQEKQATRTSGPGRVDLSEPSPDWLGSPRQFVSRLHREYERMARYGLPLSFLGLRIQTAEGEETPRVGLVDEFVVERFATRIRCSDAVYRFPHPGCYLLVLPGTPKDGAEAVHRRLVSEASREWQSPGEVHAHVTTPGPSAPDPDALLNQLVEEFRRSGPMLFESEVPMDLSWKPSLGGLRHFRRDLSAELGLAMRNEYPLQILSIRSAGAHASEPGLVGELVAEFLSAGLRRVDSACNIGENHVGVILPMTTEEAGETVAARIRKAFNDPERELPCGEVLVEVLSFGARYPYFGAFIQALSKDRPVCEAPVKEPKP